MVRMNCDKCHIDFVMNGTWIVERLLVECKRKQERCQRPDYMKPADISCDTAQQAAVATVTVAFISFSGRNPLS